MHLWKIIQEGERAQNNILDLLTNKSQRQMTDENLQQNQFLNINVNVKKHNDKQQNKNNQLQYHSRQYTFHNSKKNIHEMDKQKSNSSSLKVLQNLQVKNNLDFSISQYQITEPNQISVNLQEITNYDFIHFIQGIQLQQKKKLSQKGIEKILKTLKQQLYNIKNSKISSNCDTTKHEDSGFLVDQSKYEISTGKNSQVRISNATTKSNKQNVNHKATQGRYQNFNKKKSQMSFMAASKTLKPKKQNR